MVVVDVVRHLLQSHLDCSCEPVEVLLVVPGQVRHAQAAPGLGGVAAYQDCYGALVDCQAQSVAVSKAHHQLHRTAPRQEGLGDLAVKVVRYQLDLALGQTTLSGWSDYDPGQAVVEEGMGLLEADHWAGNVAGEAGPGDAVDLCYRLKTSVFEVL